MAAEEKIILEGGLFWKNLNRIHAAVSRALTACPEKTPAPKATVACTRVIWMSSHARRSTGYADRGLAAASRWLTGLPAHGCRTCGLSSSFGPAPCFAVQEEPRLGRLEQLRRNFYHHAVG